MEGRLNTARTNREETMKTTTTRVCQNYFLFCLFPISSIPLSSSLFSLHSIQSIKFDTDSFTLIHSRLRF